MEIDSLPALFNSRAGGRSIRTMPDPRSRGCPKWGKHGSTPFRPPHHLFKCCEWPGKASGIEILAWFPSEARQRVALGLDGKLSLRRKKSPPRPEASSLFPAEVPENPGRSLLLISYYYRPPSSLIIRPVNRKNVQVPPVFRDSLKRSQSGAAKNNLSLRRDFVFYFPPL